MTTNNPQSVTIPQSRENGGRSFAKAFLIYGIAFGIAGATPFFLLPFLTHNLDPTQFGLATSFVIVTNIIANIAGLSSHGYVSVRYFKDPLSKFADVFSASIVAVAAGHLCAACLAFTFAAQLRAVAGLPLDLALAAVLTSFFVSINVVCLAVFQSSDRPILYLYARLIQAALELTLCIALILVISLKAEARVISYAVALLSSAAFGLTICVRKGYLSARPTKQDLVGLARFGVPMLPHIVAGTAISNMDRLVVSSRLGVGELGIFMVAIQIGMILSVLIEPMNKAFAPWLFSQLARNDIEARRRVVKSTYGFYCVLVILGFALVVTSTVLFDRIFPAQYGAARNIIPYVVAGFVFQGMYYSVANYLFYAEKTGYLSIATSTTAIGGTALSYGLVSEFGLTGAGFSFAISNCVLFLAVWLAARRAVPMPWRLSRT
jgi:O-antigen/teichoic acid export membrane protein